MTTAVNNAGPIIEIADMQITAQWAAVVVALGLGLVSLIFSAVSVHRSKQALRKADRATNIEVIKFSLDILCEYRAKVSDLVERYKKHIESFVIIYDDQARLRYEFLFKNNTDESFDEIIEISDELLDCIRSFDLLEVAIDIIDNEKTVYLFCDSLVFARYYKKQRKKSSYSQEETAKYISSNLVGIWKIFFYDIKNELDTQIANHRSEIIRLRQDI